MTQVSPLVSAIRSERTGIQALVQVLEQERDTLRAGEIDRLADIAPRKRELLLHIAHLGEHRNRLLEHTGMSGDRRGMETWLKINEADGNTTSEWRALLELTQSAHQLNQENGLYIDAGMRANQQQLQALMSAGAATSTYGPGGRSTSPLGSRTLASA
jgi:flagella synthesis protein FlgN